MHLAIDVGNTETMLGLFGPDALEPEAHWRISSRVARTGDELRLLLAALLGTGGVELSQLDRAVLGSVVPAQIGVFRDALSSVLPLDALLSIDSDAQLPIRLDVEEPRTVGADRIVNTLAASHLFNRDTIVVDLGTATTYDCITADGVFVGGVIAPGLQAGREWLKGQTAKLPTVELGPPELVIGRRTETCVQSGLFHGAVAAVDGIVDRIREEWERPDAFVVSTGGWAVALSPHTRSIQAVHPHLTLLGLELAGRYRFGEMSARSTDQAEAVAD
jgi:type III pantothenate kinase